MDLLNDSMRKSVSNNSPLLRPTDKGRKVFTFSMLESPSKGQQSSSKEESEI